MGLLVDGCAICNGIGQVAAGASCPVCGGTGVATAEQAATYRQLLVDAAVEAATERFRQAGTSAAEGVLRGLAQAREDARETAARAGEVLSALLEVRRTALEIQAASLEIRSHPAAALLVEPGAPDPTDPPPGITLPAGMGGEIFYYDSLLVRQLDVWGPANIPNFVGPGAPSPIVAQGDLIVGNASGFPARLAIGTVNQVLTVVGGTAAWANNPAGFANPMTTAGDLIFENATPAPARLAIGANGQVLTVAGGLPSWANSPAGFANPMTSVGDLILGGAAGAAGRLGIGAAGQVLTVAGGTAIWQTNPAGFANPMTTSGDMIVATAGGAATRLPVGSNSQVLSVVGGVPAWAANSASLGTPVGGPSPSQQVLFRQPSGAILVLPLSTYGIANGDDGLWINNAYGLLPTQTDIDTGIGQTVGQVWLTAAVYNIISGIVKPPMADLIGSGMGTVLSWQSAGSCVSSHYGPVGGGNQNLTKAGLVFNLRIDGTNASGVSVGLDMGDGDGHSAEYVWIANFQVDGSTGLLVNNQHFFTEKASFKKIYLWNNSTACMMSTSVSDISHEYNDYELYLRVFGKGTGPNTSGFDQRGVVISGVHFNGSLKVRGNNITPINTLTPISGRIPAQLSLYTSGGTAGSMQGHIDFHMECNGGGLAPYKIYLGDANVSIGDNGAEGVLRWAGGTDPATPSIGQFAFKGIIDECTPLRRVQAPAAPLSGVGYQSVQCDAWVTITGGTVTQVVVDGVTQLNNVGPFFVGWNRFITVTYTGTLTWSWSNAS